MSLIQPVLMAVMGISIGVIFLAVYSPMLSIMGNI
jgi:type II secretory pathway component PulF